MPVRGIRGATVVDRDEATLIRAATVELLEAISSSNALDLSDIVSIIFTTTPDLTSEYPARAARDLGWTHLPRLAATEMDVPHGLAHCIRVLVHVNTDRPADAVQHVYLHAARVLRPDR